MGIGLAVASSHAPALFRPPELWPRIYAFLIDDVPQPAQAAEETPEVLQGYAERIERAFDSLKARLEAYQPDVLLIVGDDQDEVFGRPFRPTLSVFQGESATGTLSLSYLGEPDDARQITLPGYPELARHLVTSLLEQGFDPAWSEVLQPVGRPGRGLGHAFTRPYSRLAPRPDLPVVILDVNCYYPPMPSARRCFELGQALRRALENRPEKIALCASGGLSHDPRGPRAGWIDEPLDRWFLAQLAAGRADQVDTLFTLDSETLRGGTGEIRSWIVAAAACHPARATVVDYLPVHHAVTGLGFAYWEL